MKLAAYGSESEEMVRKLSAVGSRSGSEYDYKYVHKSPLGGESLKQLRDVQKHRPKTARGGVRPTKSSTMPVAKNRPATSSTATRLVKTGPIVPSYARETKTSQTRRKFNEQGRKNRAHDPTHYYIQLADIPFVAGKSVGKSHHAGANIQQLLADLKKSRSYIKPMNV